jgi:hypothetical protein
MIKLRKRRKLIEKKIRKIATKKIKLKKKRKKE